MDECATRILLGCLGTVLRVHTGILNCLLIWNQSLSFVECPAYVTCHLCLFGRMLVYEYVDNGNLDQWLHGDVGEVSPLTWDIRMNIVLGTAKGYDN